MPTPNGTAPLPDHGNIPEPVTAVAALLLRVADHEQAGLTHRCAVLAAGSELGLDPAAILRAAREVSSCSIA